MPLTVYAVTLGAFLVLDFLWLTLMGQRFYGAEIGPLLLDKPNLLVAAPFYLIYPAALTMLAVVPAAAGGGGVWGALWRGALLGLAAYATYNLTNLATLKGWSTLLTVVDLAWGTTGSALASAAGWMMARRRQ
jgi:uncharacterized membrane protein